MESPKLMLLAMVDYTGKVTSGWYYKLITSAPVVAYSQFFGGDGYILLAFYAVFSMDLLIGIAKAFKNSSFKLRRVNLWLVKFVTYSLCLGIVGLLNGAVEHGWGVNVPVLDTVLIILIATEAISIFENLNEMGYSVPPFLLQLASRVKSKASKKLDKALKDDSEDSERGE
jgi:phage-related holin